MNAEDTKEVYITSGARKEIRKIKAGILILAIATVVGIWAFTNRADRNLRHEINKLGYESCIAGIATVSKYNDLVNSIITTRQQALNVAIKEHDKQQIALNAAAVKRYKGDLLPVSTVEKCKNPIIRP